MAVLLAATLFGAEFRWGYWKTLSTTEPRRGVLVAAKLTNLWLLILVALVVILMVSYALHPLFARVYRVQSPEGWPSLPSVFETIGTAWLTIGFYATAAATLTVWVRSSLAGLVGAIGFVVTDGVLLLKVTIHRRASPVEQVAALMPDLGGFLSGVTAHVWFPQAATSTIEEHQGFTRTLTTPLPPIHDWQAVAVLIAWALFFVGLGYLVVRKRDIPA